MPTDEISKDLEKCLNINKMQHQYIQNLQKANQFLKSRVQDLEGEVVSIKSAENSAKTSIASAVTSVPEETYKLVPVGKIEEISKQQAY